MRTQASTERLGLFLMSASVPWTLADGMTILGLPRKSDNENTEPQPKGWFFLAHKHRAGTCPALHRGA